MLRKGGAEGRVRTGQLLLATRKVLANRHMKWEPRSFKLAEVLAFGKVSYTPMNPSPRVRVWGKGLRRADTQTPTR